MPDFRDDLAREVMTSPVSTIRPTDSLREAVLRLYDETSCLVVDMDDPALGYGILTRKDVLGVLADEGSTLHGLTVADAMTHPMVVVQPNYNVATCIQLMRMVGVRRAAVVEGTQVVGLVTFTDIFRRAVESGGHLEPLEAGVLD